MPDIDILIIITIVFFLAGSVKGVIGLGLPTVSLGLLTVLLDLTSAMALLLMPSFVTNLWQGVVGGNLMFILRRVWPFLILATITIWIGGLFLGTLNLALLSGLLGLLLIAYGGLSLSGFKLTLSEQQRVWTGPLFGIVNGILTGLTGSFVVPGVMYLQATGMTRDQLVQAMGVLFTLSTVGLAVSLQNNQLLTQELGLTSFLAVIPAIIGMIFGQKIRARLSEAVFRKVFFISLLILGSYIIGNALLDLGS